MRQKETTVVVVDKLYINNDLNVTPSETQNKKEAGVTRSSQKYDRRVNNTKTSKQLMSAV